MSVLVEDLVVEFNSGGYPVRPLDGFSMSVDAGRLVLLLGPSGCGKTTLLSCLSGMLTPTSGRITVDGTEVTALGVGEKTAYRRKSVGVVFQAFNLVPSLTAVENVMVPMSAAGVRRSEAKQRATTLLGDVGLADRLGNRPGNLSGGQMQRVAIARALALDPPVIVADEPTANLDHVQVDTVLRILRSLTRRGRTLIVSTHDTRLLPLADEVIEMSKDHTTVAAPEESMTIADGEVLFHEGDKGDRLYRVEHGTILISNADRPSIELTGGAVFGEMAPLFRISRSATATAVGPVTLTSFSVEAFERRFGGDELRRLVDRW